MSPFDQSSQHTGGENETTAVLFKGSCPGNSWYFPGNRGVTHDFGWFESPDSWTSVEFESSKYLSLGDSNWAKQRIAALNFWTGDTPSWEESTNADGNIEVSHRPPFYEGATLLMSVFPMRPLPPG